MMLLGLLLTQEVQFMEHSGFHSEAEGTRSEVIHALIFLVETLMPGAILVTFIDLVLIHGSHKIQEIIDRTPVQSQ